MMKACKNNVHFVHSLEWSMGAFDGIQDLIGEKASTRQYIDMVMFKTWRKATVSSINHGLRY